MDDSRKTILHYTGYDHDRGGIVSIVRVLAAENRFACELGVSPGFKREQTTLPFCEFPGVRGEKIDLIETWRARRVAHKIQSWLHADSRRIFHGHSRAGMLVGLWLRRMGESRVVVSVHCYGSQRWLYRWVAKRLGDRLYWLSPAMKRHYRVPHADSWAQCVPGCVPLRRFERDAHAGGAREVVRIAGVGMLVQWKRWHVVLEALALVPPDIRARLKFIHIGSTVNDDASRAYEASLRRQTSAFGLDNNVEWRGQQPNADALLREVDCLVIASLREPLSIAMMEALSAGVPVLGSRSGGNTDVITEPRTGFFFEPDNAPDLAAKLRALVETDALRRIEVRAEDLARFDVRAVAAQWAEIYGRL